MPIRWYACPQAERAELIGFEMRKTHLKRCKVME